MSKEKLSEQYRQLQQKALHLHQAGQMQDHKPVIAAWGLMNAGKSYLLNMLSAHIDTEYFKTNDIRETAEIKKFESAQYIYLDTPGLDANAEDDNEAFRGAMCADMILFTHQPPGELEKKELDFLADVKQLFGDSASKHIILVLSKADKFDETDLDQIEAKILQQCRQYLDFEPKCFHVSGTRFKKGSSEHKAGLIKASHVDDLIQYIDDLAAEAHRMRKQRLLHNIDQLLAENKQLAELLTLQKQEDTQHLQDQFEPFRKNMIDLDSFIHASVEKAQHLQNQARN